MTEIGVTAVLLLTVLTPLALRERRRRGPGGRHPTPGTPAAGRSPGSGDRRAPAALGVVLVAVALLGPELLRVVL